MQIQFSTNINKTVHYAEIVKQVYSSSFHFQMVFHIICGCTIGEYIRNRRLSLAETDKLYLNCYHWANRYLFKNKWTHNQIRSIIMLPQNICTSYTQQKNKRIRIVPKLLLTTEEVSCQCC